MKDGVEGGYFAQSPKEDISRWMNTSPLDARDIAQPKAINKRLAIFEASVIIMMRIKPHPRTCESRDLMFLASKQVKTPLSLLGHEEINWNFKGLLWR